MDIKSVTIEHPKTSHKLCKTIRPGKQCGADKNTTSPLYNETTKWEKFLVVKNAKITMRSHAYKVMEVFIMLIF